MRKSRALHFVLLFQYCIFASQQRQSNKTILLPSATVQSDGTHIMVGVNVSTVGLSTKMLVAQTSTTNIDTTFRSHYTSLTYHSSTASIQRTSLKNLTYSTNIVPLKSRPTLPQTSTQKNPHTPTNNKPAGKTTPILHKVGLIVGIVSGLIILSLCLIIFHKKEARVACLRLLCKPCTKNYSRYNIVPIYVYDDNEQDIRELQDDSDLPLV